jgi:hypothetical protein
MRGIEFDLKTGGNFGDRLWERSHGILQAAKGELGPTHLSRAQRLGLLRLKDDRLARAIIRVTVGASATGSKRA